MRNAKGILTIVLYSIAAFMLITLIIINRKPDYSNVYKIQTTQSAQEQSVEKTKSNKNNIDLAKNEEPISADEVPFISGLSQWKLYGANGGYFVYKDNNSIWRVSLSLNQCYMDCVISNEQGNCDTIPLVNSDCDENDYTSEDSKYIIGQHDFDNDGINEIVIGMYSPNDKDEDRNFATVVVYRVYDGEIWKFDFPYRVNGILITVTSNEIKVPWSPAYGMGFDMDHNYVFENGDFVDTEFAEGALEEYE